MGLLACLAGPLALPGAFLARRLTRGRVGWPSLLWALFLGATLGLAAGAVLRDAQRMRSGPRQSGMSAREAAAHPELEFVEVRSPRRLAGIEGVTTTVTRYRNRDEVHSYRVWACQSAGEAPGDPISLWSTNEVQGSGWARFERERTSTYQRAVGEATRRHGVQPATPFQIVNWVASPEAALRARYGDALELLALGAALVAGWTFLARFNEREGTFPAAPKASG